MCLASHKWDLGKQCRSRSDAAFCSVWFGSTLFAYRNLYSKLNQNEKVHQKPLKFEMHSSNWEGWKCPLVIFGLKVKYLQIQPPNRKDRLLTTSSTWILSKSVMILFKHLKISIKHFFSSPEPKAHRWAYSIGRHPSSINIFKRHLLWSHEADS